MNMKKVRSFVTESVVDLKSDNLVSKQTASGIKIEWTSASNWLKNGGKEIVTYGSN